MNHPAHTRASLALYGLLAMPLAFVGLPLYVHLPKYYADTHGVSLALLGAILLALRIFDTVQDPLIGLWSDRVRSRRRLMAIALPFLAVAIYALFNYDPRIPAAWWLGGWLLIAFSAFSVVQINFYAYGTESAPQGTAQTRLSLWREGFLFLGIMLAAILPYAASDNPAAPDYTLFGLSALVVIALLGGLSLRFGHAAAPRIRERLHLREIPALLRHKDMRWLLGFFSVSALAGAIPATLYLFFIEDILGAPEHGGTLLLVYFISGVAAMPLWAKLATRYGRRRTLFASFTLMSGCFIWAFTLQQGDIVAFYIITMATGSALGADLALPAAMYADILKRHNTSASVGFGLWNFVGKLTLSLAAGITLPLLAFVGYAPASGNEAATYGENTYFWLSFSYALLPCALKMLALGILILSPLERNGALTIKEETP